MSLVFYSPSLHQHLHSPFLALVVVVVVLQEVLVAWEV